MWFKVRMSHLLSHVIHCSCDHVICKKSFTSNYLILATGNLVNLKKPLKCLQLKTNSWLAIQDKIFDNFGRKLKTFSNQTFHRRSYFTRFRKFVSIFFWRIFGHRDYQSSKFFLHLVSLNDYVIYDETYNVSMHQRYGIYWNQFLLNLISRY